MDGQIPELNAHNIFLVRSHLINPLSEYDSVMTGKLIKSGGRLQRFVRRHFQTKVHAQRTKFLRERSISRVSHQSQSDFGLKAHTY